MIDIRKTPKTGLILYLTIAALVFALVASIIYWSVGHTYFADKDNVARVGALSFVMQGVLGVAVSLASAITTIYLAVLGLRLVEEQSERDRTQNAMEFLKASIQPFLVLATSLTDFLNANFALYSAVHWKIESIKKDVPILDQESFVLPVVREMLPAVLASLNRLETALLGIWASSEAVSLCQEVSCVSRYNSLANRLHPDWCEVGLPNEGPERLLINIRFIREHLSSYLDPKPEWNYSFSYWLFHNSFRHIDPDAGPLLVASFGLLKNLDMDEWRRGGVVTNFGAAMIIDLADIIPTGAEIKHHLRLIGLLESVQKSQPIITSYIAACAPHKVLPPIVRKLLEDKSMKAFIGERLDRSPKDAQS